MRAFNSVEEVWRTDLCIGCGTCVSICPTHALRMIEDDNGFYTPVLDQNKCTKCNLCLKVCPGYSIEYDVINNLLYGKSFGNIFLGNFLDCYIGHSTNKRVRYTSASGGVATELLSNLVERGLIDGAIVVQMSHVNPLRPQVVIARSKKEIEQAAGSKYCPVPLNIVLKEVMETEGKYAIVGLPCHIYGLRKAELILKELQQKIVLRIGLFCARIISFIGMEILFKKIGVRPEDVVELKYRGRGWPGEMTIKLKDGNKIFLPFNDYWNFLCATFLYKRRCILCNDQTNELADISLGDAWLQELKGDRLGTSILVARTNSGSQILQDKSIIESLHLCKIHCGKVIESQKKALIFKKRKIRARMRLMDSLRMKTPYFCAATLDPTITDYLHSISILLGIYLSKKKGIQTLLQYVPLSIEKH